MSIKKLLEILDVVGSVTVCKWEIVMEIVKQFPNLEVIEKHWGDAWKENNQDSYKLDLSDINTWSTYEPDCIDLVFTLEFGKLICNANIYNGDILDGARKGLKFSAKLALPYSFVQLLEGHLLRQLDKTAEIAYQYYLREQEWLFKENFKNKVLNDELLEENENETN